MQLVPVDDPADPRLSDYLRLTDVVLRRLRLSDLLFHNLTRLAALLGVALLSGVILALVLGAEPALPQEPRE